MKHNLLFTASFIVVGEMPGRTADRCAKHRRHIQKDFFSGRNLVVWLACLLLGGLSPGLQADTVTAGVATRGGHAIFMDPEGAIWGLGLNSNGQLGDGTTTLREVAVRLQTSTGPFVGAAGMSCGAAHSIVLNADGTVWATGQNNLGQLGNGATTQQTKAVQVLSASGPLAGIRSVAAGSHHNLALTTDGEVWAWGYNTSGQLGIGSLINQTRAVKIPGLTGVVAISAGDAHSYAVKSDGTVWAWGKNANGQLGTNTLLASQVPVQVLSGAVPLAGVMAVSAGQNYGLFLKSNGTVWGVGLSSSGQLGDGTGTQRLTAVQVLGAVAGFEGIVDIAAGDVHSVFLKSDGTVWSTGSNGYGQLGDGTLSNRTKAVQVSGLADVVLVSAGGTRTFAVKSDGTICAWGDNTHATLGNAQRSYLSAWTTLPGFEGATQAAASSMHALLLDPDGTVWGAGKNNYGQLGNGLTTDTNTPVQALTASGPLGDVRALAVGSWHSLALCTDGSVWAWGNNGNGRLGDGTATTRTKAIPVIPAVAPFAGVTAVAAGDAFSLALREGTVLAWGTNGYGQLGDGTTVEKRAPVTVQTAAGPLDNITAIASGSGHVAALKNNGTVWVWGLNTNGQLGLDTTINQTLATQVPGVTDAIAIAAGAAQTYILRADGTLWATGQNNLGQLADGTNTGRRTLVQVRGSEGPLTGLTWVLGGSLAQHASAGGADGSAWIWGQNDLGQLGDASQLNTNKAVVVPAGLRPMALGAKTSFAIRPNSEWEAAGTRFYGQMGDGYFGYSTQAISARAMSFAMPAPDADNDGVADWIELSQGTNPDVSDTDGDGTNDGSDPVPTDYYNGIAPVVEIISGNNQTAALGARLALPMVVKITKAGVPMPNAPVTFSVASGGLEAAPMGTTMVGTLALRTDASGQTSAYYTLPPVDGSYTIRVQAGTAVGNLVASSNLIPESPTFSVLGGGYTSQRWVVPTTTSPGAGIYYTLDGSDPGAGSLQSPSGRAVHVPRGATIKAMAMRPGGPASTASSTLCEISGMVGAGAFHMLALRPDATVWGLGLNSNGQLGDGTTILREGAVRLERSSGQLLDAVELDGGVAHSIVLSADGTVWATGQNNVGQLGNGATVQQTKAVQVLSASGPLAGIRSIAAGSHHNLALTTDGEVWAWGYNTSGQLGIGSLTNQTRAVKIPGLTGVVAVSAGDAHSYAVKSDGTVWAWGKNANGQLGTNTLLASQVPVQVLSGAVPLAGVMAVSAGQNYGLFLKSNGTVWGVGLNSSGQLGDGTGTQRLTAAQVLGAVPGFEGIVDIAAGDVHSVFLKSDGTVWSTGSNGYGQLGDGTLSNRTKAVQVPGLADVVLVSAGGTRTFAVKSDGTICAWGDNTHATLGNAQRSYLSAWTTLPGFEGATQVAASSAHTLLLDPDGTVWGAGKNNYGQLGNGLTTDTNTPVQAQTASGPLGDVRALAVGSYHSLALRADGSVWAWGNNGNGRLGDGTATTRTKAIPVIPAVAPFAGVTALAAGDAFSLALREGTVLAWGTNGYGQLGDGTSVEKRAPVTVQTATGPLDNITAIASGSGHAAALKNNGTVWVWGLNTNGQLGLDTTINQPLATQVPGVTDAIAIAAGAAQTYILRADGTLWATGQNNLGQLADGTNTGRRTLVQVRGSEGPLTGLTWVLGGSLAQHASAGGADGSAWIWGQNDLGQLGNASQVHANKAEPVPAGLRPMALGAKTSFAIRSNSEWAAAGTRFYGQMGDGYFGYSKQAMTARAMSFAMPAPDADNDGVADWIELSQGTNPDVSDTDADNDGLNDAWEIVNFGDLNQDANADPDGDGLTNLAEYQQASEPNNYFSQNGLLIIPQIQIASGSNQTGPAGGYAPLPLVVKVVDAANPAQVLPNAPVQFLVTAGTGMLDSDLMLPATGNRLNVNASQQGLAEANFHFSTTVGEEFQVTVQVGSQSAIFSLKSQEPLPAAPQNIEANSLSSFQIVLAWTDAANNETGYKVERSQDGSTFIEIASELPANVTGYTDNALRENTQFFYRVRSTNAAGDSSYSNIATATTHSFVDIDNDKMDDTWESANELNPDVDDSQDDKDGDRIPNIFEFKHRTAPNDANSKPEPTFVVDPSLPDNSWNGKSCAAIQAAVDKAQNGYDAGQGWVDPEPYALIEVKAGVYEEFVAIGIVPLLLLGELGSPKGPVEILGNVDEDVTLFIQGASVIDGFVITHMSGYTGLGIFAYYDPNDGTEAPRRRLVNCLIVNNHSKSECGGVYNKSANLSLVHCTITGNTASTEGNGIYTVNGSVDLINSIVWNTVAADDPNLADSEIANYDTVFTAINSLIGNGEQGGINEDPKLTDSGWLQSGSPAINRPGVILANASLVDIHGIRRDSDGIPDMGAEEWVDIDIDGLSDRWEMKWFGTLNNDDAHFDDSDGFTKAEEFANGTDPTNPDTDGDGVPDAISAPKNLVATAFSSFQIALSWIDSSRSESGYKVERSQDGSKFIEIVSDLPKNTTSYTDSSVKAGTFYFYRVYATHPVRNSLYSNVSTVWTEGMLDADSDGMDDTWETAKGLDPLVDDSQEDRDGDRMPNVFEYEHGTAPNDANSKPAATLVVDPSIAETSATDNIFSTIQEAVDSARVGYQTDQGSIGAQPYAIIEVKAGVYNGKVTLSDIPLLLIAELGAPEGPVKIQGIGDFDDYTLVMTCPAIVDGFIITHKSGCFGAGVYSFFSSSWSVGSSNRRLVNCLILENRESGSGGGVYNKSSDLTLSHCTMTRNMAAHTCYGIYNDSGKVTLTNSIVWDRGPAGEFANQETFGYGAASQFVLTNTIIGGGAHGGIDEDPQLTPAGWLKANSPAIDRVGVTSTLSALVDINGERRDFEGPPDLGADEYHDDNGGDDGDGLPDWLEGLDDADGLSGLDEYQVYGTDLRFADTDGDGLSDGLEVALGSNPKNADTDADGMGDAYEVANGLNPSENDGLQDRDGDRVPNIFEFARGTSVHDSDSKPASTFIVDQVLGDDSPSDNIYSTIRQAVDLAQGGYWNDSIKEWMESFPYSIVEVRSGCYPEALNLGGSPILLLGQATGSQGAPVITGSMDDPDSPLVLITTDVVMDGFDIARRRGNGNGVTVYSPSIPRCKVRLLNCIIRNNSAGGVDSRSYDETQHLDLIHCTVTGNTCSWAGPSGVEGEQVQLINSIVWGNSSIDPDAPEVQSNLDSINSIVGGGANNGIDEDPQLTPTGRLKATSPALNRIPSGTLWNHRVAQDIDGELRPAGDASPDAPDLGADEFRDADDDHLPDLVDGADDADGVESLVEYENFGTNPTLYDTDGDGRSDGDEIADQSHPTNPLDPDTDGDGMDDQWEIANGLNALVSDGMDDPDGDRIPNKFEYIRGKTDPQNAASKPAANIFVDSTIGDANAQDKCYAMISEAVAVAELGYWDELKGKWATNDPYPIIEVKSGVYSDHITLGVPMLLLGELGDPRGIPIIKCPTGFATVRLHSDSILDGFVITHGPSIQRPGVEVDYSTHGARLVNCIIRDNSAYEGAGVLNYGKLDLLHCTLIGNHASNRGNAIFNSYSTLNLINCIVWGNGDSTSQQIYSKSISSVHGGESCIIQNGEFSGMNLDPQLSPVGLFQSHLSPAVNRDGISLASTSRLDIHGERRDEDGTPDLGADEYCDANGVNDGDGVPDSQEFDDGDGLSEGDEVLVYGTSQFLWDTDGDGLGDGDEISNASNPLTPDTDGDGMLDRMEVENGLDPNLDDSLEDSDGDRVPNIFESKHGTFVNNEESTPDPTFTVDAIAGSISTTDNVFSTIQEAVDRAVQQEAAYAIIDVKPGLYAENISISSIPILVLGNRLSYPGLVVIQAPSSYGQYAVMLQSNSVLDGLVISHLSGSDGGGVFCGDEEMVQHARLANCIIRNNRTGGGGVYNTAEKLDLIHCTIVDNMSGGQQQETAIYNEGEMTLANCIVWGKSEATQSLIHSTPGSAIKGAETCIVQDGEWGGIDENPSLTPEGFLKDTSPAINRMGVPSAAASRVDILGERRDTDAAPDLGADEYHDDNGVDDGDGIPDMWELNDGDALSAWDEINVYFTNPEQSDTDGDGLDDYQEIHLLHVDPLRADSDGDLLSDSLELQIGTDPANEDTDGDKMTDGWEYRWRDYPVHPNPLVGDALEDIDWDAHSNLTESQLRTNPCVYDVTSSGPDWDYDGFSNVEETEETFTNPTVEDQILLVPESRLQGKQGTFSEGAIEKDTAIFFYNTQAEAVYDFDVSAENAYVATIAWEVAFGSGGKNSFLLHLWCDGIDLGYRNLDSGVQGNHALRVFLPYISAGSHQLKIEIRSPTAAPCLQINEIIVAKIVNDADSEVSTITQGRLNSLNGILTTANESPVSPLCLEGNGRFVETILVNDSIAPRPTTKDHWFADVPLNPVGPTAVNVSFENGVVNDEMEVTWSTTNIFTCEKSLTLRKGDSLKMIAVPLGTPFGPTSVIQIGSETFSADPTTPVIYQFDTGGVVLVAAQYGQQKRTITVNVVEADFGNRAFGVAGASRVWECAGVPDSLPFDSDSILGVSRVQTFGGGSRFNLETIPDENIHRIVARTVPGGPIVAVGEVQGFRYYSWRDCSLQDVGDNLDGRDILEMTVRLSIPWEEGIALKLNTWKAGSTFDDGSIIRTWTASDVAEDGSITIRFYHPKDIGGPCHEFGLFQGSAHLN